MPFDGKNFQQTKSDVFSLEGLIAWLETQPATKEYCWTGGGCLFEQFGEAHLPFEGPEAYCEAIDRFRANDWSVPRSGEPWMIAIHKPWTFGAALDRARALLAARQP